MSRLENEIQTTNATTKAITVQDIVRKPTMVTRFSEVLGGQDKANQFLASLISAVNGNSALAKCSPMKVIKCAMVAASLNLDVNPNLGLASIVPYNKKWKDDKGKWHEEQIPQFQMGWKGFVQLAIRTNQYKSMNVTEVYADEFESHDPYTGELKYHIVQNGDRANGRSENIVGYFFCFELTSGFVKKAYMSKEDALNHAKHYSRAFQNDLKYGTQTSPWSTMFDAMAEKTIVKNTLSKWGILSTQFATAQSSDDASFSEDGDLEYVDEADNIVEIPEEKPIEEPQKDEPQTEPTQEEMFSEEDFNA